MGTTSLPLQLTPTGAFGLTILSNTVLVGAFYPLWLAARNAAEGRLTPAMFVGRPIPWSALSTTHGRLLENRTGFTRSGLDLDALRMYLRWRGSTLGELRRDPDRYRRPESLPADPLPAGDGAVAVDEEPRLPVESSNRGGRTGARTLRDDRSDRQPSRGAKRSDGCGDADRARTRGGRSDDSRRRDIDEWGAQAFLDDVGSAYGTTPTVLRDGLELLTIRDLVWVSPGIPFVVPILLGLLLALIYGDLLIAALGSLGII